MYAIVKNDTVEAVGTAQQLFPECSFPASGMDDSFMLENNVMFTMDSVEYDPNTQKMVNTTPYIVREDNLHWVYTVEAIPLTPEEIAQVEEQHRLINKSQAESLLSATDWTATVDIANPQYSNPYLGNQDAFLAYRSKVRNIAVNPPITVESWPILPTEEWISV